MIAETSRFGKIEHGKSEIITMVRGILGFDSYIRFITVSLRGQEPFKWLQSLEDPDLAFLMIDPLFFKPDYIVEINPNDLVMLKTKSIDDIAIFVLVSIPKGQPALMSANLQAPLVINKSNMNAAQLVLGESYYNTNHSIFKDLERRLVETPMPDHD
ncbi:MAG: flagellar assembly protein FliW [Candidatus Zixiibacteriota bacterium]|nr:MAG: flagellar assembly protein FliW [candidate division Zixibacteria bacterium]